MVCFSSRILQLTRCSPDSNRERVLKSPHFGAIFECLQSDSSRHIALASLYNISLDYEPAQQALREKDLFLELVKIPDTCSHDAMMVHHLSSLLSVASQDWDVSQSPDTILKALIQFSDSGNFAIDDLLPIISILMTHLKQERFQRLLFSATLFEAFLLLVLCLFGYEMTFTSLPPAFPWNPPPEDESEDFEPLQTTAIATLRDLSSHAMFFEMYPFGSTTTKTWFSWLNSDNPDLQLISCCLLSNLAREKEQWAVQMVTVYGAHMRLGELREGIDDRVPLAALELLLQLARFPQNRGRICTQDFLGHLSRTWSIGSGRLIRTQYASIAVLLGLVRDCPQAVLPLVEHTTTITTDQAPQINGSHLQQLITCFEQSSNPKVQTEIAKVVMAISKALTTFTTSDELDADKMWRDCLSVRPTFVAPLTPIITQTEDPALQAQAYFTLVIVARHEMGIAMVRDVVQQPAARHMLLAAQSQTVDTAQDGQGEAIIQRSLRDNARCLVTQFPDMGPEEKNVERRSKS